MEKYTHIMYIPSLNLRTVEAVPPFPESSYLEISFSSLHRFSVPVNVAEYGRLHACTDHRACLPNPGGEGSNAYRQVFLNSFLGGPLLGFGCALALSTNASPWFQTNAPGLIKSISAAFFPVGIMMVILTGADLFTSYILVRHKVASEI